MTEDYAEVTRNRRASVVESGGKIIGVIVLTIDNEKMSKKLALYTKIGYVEYDRRPAGGTSLVYMRKSL